MWSGVSDAILSLFFVRMGYGPRFIGLSTATAAFGCMGGSPCRCREQVAGPSPRDDRGRLGLDRRHGGAFLGRSAARWLAPSLVLGAVLSTPLATLTVKRVPLRQMRGAIGFGVTALGLYTLSRVIL